MFQKRRYANSQWPFGWQRRTTHRVVASSIISVVSQVVNIQTINWTRYENLQPKPTKVEFICSCSLRKQLTKFNHPEHNYLFPPEAHVHWTCRSNLWEWVVETPSRNENFAGVSATEKLGWYQKLLIVQGEFKYTKINEVRVPEYLKIQPMIGNQMNESYNVLICNTHVISPWK